MKHVCKNVDITVRTCIFDLTINTGILPWQHVYGDYECTSLRVRCVVEPVTCLGKVVNFNSRFSFRLNRRISVCIIDVWRN